MKPIIKIIRTISTGLPSITTGNIYTEEIIPQIIKTLNNKQPLVYSEFTDWSEQANPKKILGQLTNATLITVNDKLKISLEIVPISNPARIMLEASEITIAGEGHIDKNVITKYDFNCLFIQDHAEDRALIEAEAVLFFKKTHNFCYNKKATKLDSILEKLKNSSEEYLDDNIETLNQNLKEALEEEDLQESAAD